MTYRSISTEETGVIAWKELHIRLYLAFKPASVFSPSTCLWGKGQIDTRETFF